MIGSFATRTCSTTNLVATLKQAAALGAFGITLLATASAAQAAGSVKGSIKLVGKAPEAAPINMKADPYCAKQPGTKDEEVVVGKAGELKNVVVRIAKGVATPPEPPTTAAVVDQSGCMYHPRIVVVQAGQPVEIRNSDMTLHNVHTYKGTQTLFNLAAIQGTPPKTKKFPTVGDIVKFKCDVHPWMTGYVLVTDNPYHVVTNDDGKFDLEGVPPGNYTLEAWHEKYGTVTKEITVADGKPVDLKLEFKAK
jgi:plastocyanin